MAKEPMLSVIVPVYNAEKTLGQCLESIAGQTYTDFEVVLIDDGSQDNSGKMCDEWAVTDERFQVIHIVNHGVSYARNLGLDKVCGKYVMFVDSDDCLYFDYFGVLVECIEINQNDIVLSGQICNKHGICEIRKIAYNGKIQNKIWEFICLTPELFGYLHGKVYKLSIIKKNNIRFNENMYAQEDLDFNLSVYDKSNTFELIDYAGYEYEYTPGKRKPPVWDFLANSLKLYSIACQKMELSQVAKEALKTRVAGQIFSFLYHCCNKDDYTFAVKKLCGVNGLNKYLEHQKFKGEVAMVISWYLAEKYDRIYKYFQARKGVKKILGLPVSE